MEQTLSERQQLRNRMRKQRQQLDTDKHTQASEVLAHHIVNSALFSQSQHIAVYVANDGEIDPLPLIKHSDALKKSFYLPVLADEQGLEFRSYELDAPMTLNHCGIPEPDPQHSRTHSAQALDLVLMPLVAFDSSGNRLGMGAGYYDKSFAFLNPSDPICDSTVQRPMLIGMAYDFQEVDALHQQDWDVPLHGIATESGLRFFGSNKK